MIVTTLGHGTLHVYVYPPLSKNKMGTSSSWGGKPTTDWHPVQVSSNTLSLLMPTKPEISTGHVGH